MTATPGSGAGNLISGNNGTGITDHGGSNVIAGNLIGTAKGGTGAVANASDGIDVYAGGDTIGGSAAGAGNVISGNDGYGIYDDGANLIAGNLIGTDVSGTLAVPNDYPGIYVQASGSTIGGTTAAAGNVISGNIHGGIMVVASANLIEGDKIGTDFDGSAALANDGDGIDIYAGDNTIGGTTAGAGNVISGNDGRGVYDVGGSNLIAGNVIGLSAGGTVAVANVGDGIIVQAGSDTIGGTTSSAANVISGNAYGGVEIVFGASNLIDGNLIGTDAAGTVAIGNGGDGVDLADASTGNTIGGSASGAGNLISGNAYDGVQIFNSGTTGNTVDGNLIGTDITGTVAIPNATGVSIDSLASGNTIGGLTATPGTGAGNVISGNSGPGITDDGGSNVIAGNLIGVSASGTVALANGSDGIDVFAGGDTIGGVAAGAGNVISGNSGDGLVITQPYDLVAGNMIGTDITGTVALPNAIGVVVSGGSNTIGGTVATAQNLISGNMNAGIQISSSTATDNVVEGNRIGTALDGAQALANGTGPGVAIEYFATGNTIGGTTAGAANLISGNADGGIIIYGHGTIDNVVAGNVIGTNDDGTLTVALENGAGVKIYGGAAQNTIGGTVSGAGNLISGNEGDGVQIIDGYQDYVQGNRIGLDRSGTGALPNTAYGISLSQHFPAQTTSGYTTSGPGSHTGSNVIGGTGSGAERRLGEWSRRNLYHQWDHGPCGGKLRRGRLDRRRRNRQRRRWHSVGR